MPSPYVTLDHRSILTISGSNRIDFLQGLITNDMRLVSKENALYSAFLSPQGRFLTDLFICDLNDTLFIDTDKAYAPTLLKKLKLHKLRSDVHIEPVDAQNAQNAQNAYVISLPEAENTSLGHVHEATTQIVRFNDPRHTGMGQRALILDKVALDGDPQPIDIYHQKRMEATVPEAGIDLITDKAIILEYNLDELHAINWDKGCYMGQELMSRTKYRGEVRKHVMSAHFEGEYPEFMSDIMLNDTKVGKTLSHHGQSMLILIQKDALEAWQSQPDSDVSAGETRLKLA